jgi:hypothetical protein
MAKLARPRVVACNADEMERKCTVKECIWRKEMALKRRILRGTSEDFLVEDKDENIPNAASSL